MRMLLCLLVLLGAPSPASAAKPKAPAPKQPAAKQAAPTAKEPSAAPKGKVAVAPLKAPPQLMFVGKSVAQAFAVEAAGAGFDVVGPAIVEEKLGRAGTQALVACGDDAKCLAESVSKLEVDRVVGGWLDQRGTAYRVALVHVDAKTGARLGGLEREIPVASRRLQKDIAAAAPTLLAGEKDATGVLEIVTDVPGALVTVDDVPVGTTPVTRTVKPGKHKVAVSRTGWAEAEPAWVDVPANGILEHRPRIYELPARERPNESAKDGTGTKVQVVR